MSFKCGQDIKDQSFLDLFQQHSKAQLCAKVNHSKNQLLAIQHNMAPGNQGIDPTVPRSALIPVNRP